MQNKMCSYFVSVRQGGGRRFKNCLKNLKNELMFQIEIGNNITCYSIKFSAKKQRNGVIVYFCFIALLSFVAFCTGL